MNSSRLVAIGTVVVSLLLYWAAATPENTQAYLFPKLIALSMAALGIAMTFRSWSPLAGKSEAVASVPWSRLWPVLTIFVLSLLVAQDLGFYVTSWLTFVAIGVIYAPAEARLAGARRCVPISLAFLAVLYLVFVLLLQVQTPRGVLF